MTPYEADIHDQPTALERFLDIGGDQGLPPAIATAPVVLTGMGSSHFAGYPAWRRLIHGGRPAWWINTSQVLENMPLVTDDTLLWITSQSGCSAEVVALLDRLSDTGRCPHILGVTNDAMSPLARRSDTLALLHAGTEATVSTKSYLNTLAAHALLAGGPADELRGTDLRGAIDADLPLEEVAQRALKHGCPHIALIGTADHAATALTGALILKESTKIHAEAFIGGEFRHGPLEMAAPNLSVLMFTGHGTADDSLDRLAQDLQSAGSTVVSIGPRPVATAIHLPTVAGGPTAELMTAMVVVQRLSLALAGALGIEPGRFTIGSKVTATL